MPPPDDTRIDHIRLTVSGVGAPPPPANAVGLAGVTVSGTGLEPRDVVDPATGVTWTLAVR